MIAGNRENDPSERSNSEKVTFLLLCLVWPFLQRGNEWYLNVQHLNECVPSFGVNKYLIWYCIHYNLF